MHTKVMEITSPSQFRAVEKMISGGGPVTLVLVWSKTCPHCHTYMPLWKELARTKSKATNMISIEAPVYQASPLAAKKEISSVPTVLYVDEKGKIQEVEDARNKTLMSNIVRTASPPDVAEAMSEEEVAAVVNATQRAPTSSAAAGAPSMVAAPMVAAPMVAPPTPAPLSMNAMRRTSNAKPLTPPEIASAIPGTEVVPNPLPISPGATMSAEEAADSLMPEQPKPQVGGAKPQVGGNMASIIAQAAPVAILAGAYSMFGNRRSSGLPSARRTRRKRSNGGRSRHVRFSRRYRR
jgi:hypothetical protein